MNVFRSCCFIDEIFSMNLCNVILVGEKDLTEPEENKDQELHSTEIDEGPDTQNLIEREDLDSDTDIFVHQSVILETGWRYLKPGEHVRLQIR